MNGINSEHFSSPSNGAEKSNFDNARDEDLDAKAINSEHHNANSSASPELTEKLASGEELFREIAKVSSGYHVSAEHKLLFSTISNNEDRSNFPISPSHKMRVTTFGLEHQGARYPFSLEYQSLLHIAILKNDLIGSIDEEDLYRRLDGGMSINFIRHTIENMYARKINADLVSRKFKIVQNINKLRSKQPKYLQAHNIKENGEHFGKEKGSANSQEKESAEKYYWKNFQNFMLEGKILSKEEIELYSKDPPKLSFREYKEDERRDYYELGRKFKAEYKKLHPVKDGESPEDYTKRINAESGVNDIKNYFARYLCAMVLDKSNTIFNEEELKFFDPEWTKEKMIKECTNRAGKNLKEILEREKEPEQYKQELYKNIHEKIGDDSGDLFKFIEERTEEYQKFIGSEGVLKYLKYLDGRHRYFEPHYREIEKLKTRRDQIDSEIANIDKTAAKKAEAPTAGIMNRLIRVLFADANGEAGNEFSNLYFLPTGVVARSKTGRPRATLISPLDDRIVDSLKNREVEEAWTRAWLSKQTDYDSVARAAIQSYISQSLPEARDELDHKILDFSKHHQVNVMKPFNSSTGQINGDIQVTDLEAIEPMMPIIGDFIDNIELDDTNRSVNLKSTRLEILSFLAGDSAGENLLLCGSGRNLEVNMIGELLVNTDPEKHDKANSRILSEVGIALYNHLSNEEHDLYSNMIGGATNVSVMSFYKVYGKNIPGPQERRQLVERTVFLKDFIDYIKGESGPAKIEFFNSLRKKPALE